MMLSERWETSGESTISIEIDVELVAWKALEERFTGFRNFLNLVIAKLLKGIP
jgi:hypothetical protein